VKNTPHEQVYNDLLQSILEEVELQGAINHKSFQHNTQETHCLDEKWAQQYIDRPLLEDCLEIANSVHQRQCLPTIDLWTDSTDLLPHTLIGVNPY
jgi:hypothetical protein